MIPKISVVLLFLLMLSCNSSENTSTNFNSSTLISANRQLLEVAMDDGFPPPIASRVYVYPHLANYLTLQLFYPDSLPDIKKHLNGFPGFADYKKGKADAKLTALLAYSKVGKKVVFSEKYMEDLKAKFIKQAEEHGIDEATLLDSENLSDSIASVMSKWIDGDNYIETRTMDRFTSSKKPGSWQETPPDYTTGMEPHWKKIRPLVIDSAGIYQNFQFPEFSYEKNSPFYAMVKEVYDQSMTQDSSKILIAQYWDDNPNTSMHKGHLVTVQHKISPPGHWLNIIGQVANKENTSYFKLTKAYTLTAIAMFDGIISSWSTKYETDVIRPITYINEIIDVDWKPSIQTPPFPEFTSGHSVTSAAAATVMEDVFGENYEFTDSTEVIFGNGIRDFTSFDQAAWEVSLSRFYGGIHYMYSIEKGYEQGKFIGNKVLNKLGVKNE